MPAASIDHLKRPTEAMAVQLEKASVAIRVMADVPPGTVSDPDLILEIRQRQKALQFDLERLTADMRALAMCVDRLNPSWLGPAPVLPPRTVLKPLATFKQAGPAVDEVRA